MFTLKVSKILESHWVHCTIHQDNIYVINRMYLILEI